MNENYLGKIILKLSAISGRKRGDYIDEIVRAIRLFSKERKNTWKIRPDKYETVGTIVLEIGKIIPLNMKFYVEPNFLENIFKDDVKLRRVDREILKVKVDKDVHLVAKAKAGDTTVVRSELIGGKVSDQIMNIPIESTKIFDIIVSSLGSNILYYTRKN
ncbi:hypothetical protein [Candidatus Acidianus copahuensis]|nr:hypothetical protein [Candidatus Acidianus copahuensis]